MNFLLTLRVRLLLGLLAVSSMTLALTGCSGGWGAAKPTISAIAGSATTVGQTETLTVNPAGTGPFTYQWYRNGVAVPGATSASYSLTATAANNGATYTVAVTNPGGTAVSAPFVLNLGVGPAITTQPVNQTLNAGQAASFTVTATGSATLTYQWTENGAPIAGATGASYTSGALGVTDSGSMFGVIVTNAIGSVTSTPAAVSVLPLSPALAFSAVGDKTYNDPTFTVAATSPSAGAITYAVLSGPATVAGSVVTVNGAGTVVLGATQQARGNYSAGTTTATFTVGKAQPVLALAPIQGETSGTTVTTVATSTSPG